MQQVINNADSGLIARTKINSNFTELYSDSGGLFWKAQANTTLVGDRNVVVDPAGSLNFIATSGADSTEINILPDELFFEAEGAAGNSTIDITAGSPGITLESNTGAILFSSQGGANGKAQFSPNATRSGMNIGSLAGNPSGLSDGDVWYNSSNNNYRGRKNGASVSLVTSGALTENLSITGTDRSITNAMTYSSGGSAEFNVSSLGGPSTYLLSDHGSSVGQHRFITNSSGVEMSLLKSGINTIFRINNASGAVFTDNRVGTAGIVYAADYSANYTSRSLVDKAYVLSVAGASNPFADNTALVKNNADNTKLAIFSAASISAGTTRTYTLPNADGTLALTTDITTTGDANYWKLTGTSTVTTPVISGSVLYQLITASTAVAVTPMQFKATSSGDMTDGFGPTLDFYIRDTAAVDNLDGQIQLVRAGADNSGRFLFRLNNAGTTATKLNISPTGIFGFNLGATNGTIAYQFRGLAAGTAEMFRLENSTPATLISINESGAIAHTPLSGHRYTLKAGATGSADGFAVIASGANTGELRLLNNTGNAFMIQTSSGALSLDSSTSITFSHSTGSDVLFSTSGNTTASLNRILLSGGTWNPSSGTNTWTGISITGHTLNSTGTSTGLARAIYVNNTITNINTGFYAWQHDAGAIVWNSVVSPAQITSNQNDYAPASWTTGAAPGSATIMRLNTDASRNITSLVGGTSGRVAILANVGAQNIVLKNDDGATGTAANRFKMNADRTVLPDETVMVWYDGTSSRWRLIS